MRISDWSSDVCSSDLLDLLRNDVVRAHRDLLARQPRQHPAQPGLAVGALVAAEELDRRRLVRVDEIETAEDQRADDPGKNHDDPFPRDLDLRGPGADAPP